MKPLQRFCLQIRGHRQKDGFKPFLKQDQIGKSDCIIVPSQKKSGCELKKELSPETIPFFEGESYSSLFPALVPRFIFYKRALGQ